MNMDFEKLLEQEARKAARQDYEEVTEKTKDYTILDGVKEPMEDCVSEDMVQW